MVTLDDVARRAGVSAKTVSRFVNGATNIRADMRDRIADAVRELNYRPSLAARQLAGQRNFVVSMLIPYAPYGLIGQLMVAIAVECRTIGYHLVTEVVTPENFSSPTDFKLSFLTPPDAVILIAPFQDDPHILGLLEEAGILAVRLSSATDGYGITIPVEQEQISQDMVRHLIDLGHKRIGMIAPPRPDRPAEARTRGYQKALAEAGIEFDPNLVVRGEFSFASGITAATQLLALPQRPTAIYAASDDMALGAMSVAHRLGYHVPNDLALAGFDDSPASRMVFPPLTSVHQPISAIARAAVMAATGSGGILPEIRQELRLRGSTTGDREFCLGAP